MLKKRIIPVQLLMAGRLVKTVGFDAWRDVGDPVASSKIYNANFADELVFLNIARPQRTVAPLLELIARVSEVCFMPLALGGGIRTLADAEQIIRNGGDKVVLNSVCFSEADVLRRIADKFGNQAVVASIDVRRDPETGEYILFSDCGRRTEPVLLESHIAACIAAGAGEILINSIDRDGTMTGYDIPLIQRVLAASTVPVIACGGAGHYSHMKDAFATGVSALACGSLFNFGDNNPLRAKAFLSNYELAFKRI